MMLPRPILRKSAALLVLLPALCLASCGRERPRLVLPPAERAEAVAAPALPAGDSDAEVAKLIADYDAALRLANQRLEWLGIWIKAGVAR